jgi:hypothetical protein
LHGRRRCGSGSRKGRRDDIQPIEELVGSSTECHHRGISKSFLTVNDGDFIAHCGVHVQGTSYDIGDFTLRVANILLGSTYKGLLLEVSICALWLQSLKCTFLTYTDQVEYRPCSSPYGATEIIRDFVESLIPANAQLSIDTEYDYEKVGLSNQEFTIAHTGYQYMHLFRKDSLL